MKAIEALFNYTLLGRLRTADAAELFVNGPFKYIHSSVHLAPQFGAIAIQRVAVNQGHRKPPPLGPCCEFLRIIFCSRLRKAPTLGTCCQLFGIISTVSWGPCVWETPTFGPCCQLLLWRHLCLSWNTHQNTGLNLLEPGTSGEPGSSQFAYEYNKLVFLIISIYLLYLRIRCSAGNQWWCLQQKFNCHSKFGHLHQRNTQTPTYTNIFVSTNASALLALSRPENVAMKTTCWHHLVH